MKRKRKTNHFVDVYILKVNRKENIYYNRKRIL